jgi:hypothetical protein
MQFGTNPSGEIGSCATGNVLPTIEGLEKQDICLLLNARNYAYYLSMIRQIRNHECPFDRLDPELNKILFQVGSWRIWECPAQFRQKNLARHFVAASEHHFTHLHSDNHSWDELIEMLIKSLRELGLRDFRIVIRFGDPSLHAGSIRHIHVNILVPDGSGRMDTMPEENLPASLISLPTNPYNGWHIGEYSPEALVGKHLEHHFVVYSEQKFSVLSDLSRKDWNGLTGMIDLVINAEGGFGLPGGAVLISSGDPGLNGGLDYVRADIIMPDKTGRVEIPIATNVGITLAKDPKDIAKKTLVVSVFEKMRKYQEAEAKKGHVLTNVQVFHALSAKDQELVKDRLG